MTLRQLHGVQAIACVVLLVTFVFGFNVAHAQSTSATLSTSFENGALAVQGTGFNSSARVDVRTTLAGNVRDFTAVAGPQGDFVLHTNMPVSANARLDIEARDDRGTVKTLTTITPATIAPFRPIVLLPGLAGLPRSGEVPPLGTLLLGMVLIALGAVTLKLRRSSWSYSEMSARL